MQDLDDLALLREYAANHSETAFEELVSRRVGFVYSSALRQARNPHLAEEITQAVFIILARKAGKISAKTILTGWLFKTTRFAALAQIRAEMKRARQKKEFQMQSQLEQMSDDLSRRSEAKADEIWNQMSPLLDEALATLGEKDRQAVLLRFFENKSLAEVGNYLGAGEDTARKRVSRALEKLHRHFSKRGVSSTTAMLAGTISANSVQAAPVGLAKTISTVAVAKGAAASASILTLIKGAVKIMAWTKMKTALVTGVVVLLAAGTTTVIVKNHGHHSRAKLQWTPAEKAMFQGETSRLINQSKQWALAFIMFSDDHQNKLPNNFEQLKVQGFVKSDFSDSNWEIVSGVTETVLPIHPRPFCYGKKNRGLHPMENSSKFMRLLTEVCN
ncbi:MAG TPA: sigma-70 family RNA polymerase sigma factor [Verrucomicrobiae bacterium]|jgi:RNA polymerase sigma factor (sigma-70 family)|nr:sigma-70 family RNA polymerase sigma factor [Verrucomicrobiae bacterium]